MLGVALRGDAEALECARAAGVTAESFAKDAHRVIWRAIEQAEKAGAVDIVAVSALIRTGDAEESDYLGPVYLCELTEHAPVALNVEAYARELTTLATRRRMLDELVVLQRRLMHQEAFAKDDQELVADTFARLLASDPSSLGSRPAPAVVNDLLGVLIERAEAFGVGTLRGVPTGLPMLDTILGGWVAGRLYVVAARPSIGKTTMAVNFADAASKANMPWAFFTLEMESVDIVEKLLSKRAGVVGAKLQSGDLDADDLDRVHDSAKDMGKINPLPGVLDSRAGRYIESFEVAVRRLVRRDGIRVVFLDYIQQMRARGRWANRQAELTEITDRIKQLALSTGVAIVANAQLSREAEKAGTPLMSHLKESGSIEQDADAVMFLHREKPEAPLSLVVAKNRWGRKGRVLLSSRLDINEFTQAAHSPEELE